MSQGVTVLQLFPVIEGGSSRQLQELLGTTRVPALEGDCPLTWREWEEVRWGGWVRVTVTNTELHFHKRTTMWRGPWSQRGFICFSGTKLTKLRLAVWKEDAEDIICGLVLLLIWNGVRGTRSLRNPIPQLGKHLSLRREKKLLLN